MTKNEAASVAQLTDEQIVTLRRETYQGAHAQRASDLAFARAILAQAAPPAAVTRCNHDMRWTGDGTPARCQHCGKSATEIEAAPPAAPVQGDALTLLAMANEAFELYLGTAGGSPAPYCKFMRNLRDFQTGYAALLIAPFASQPAAGERFIAIAARRSLTTDEVAEFHALLAAPAAPAAGESGAEPANPYAQKGSLEEAWRRGYMGQSALCSPGSPYDKVWREGAAARIASDAGRATPPAAKSEAASQPGEMGAGVPTECQTVFGEPCQYARDIASGRVHCIHCDRDKPASAQQVEREAFEIWATDEGLPLKLTQTEKSYLDYRTTAAWDGWQARAAQQSQVDAKQDEREALTAEFVMRALRDAIADMRAIKCDVPESASLIGYFGNRIRAAKQVQAGGEDKRIADLEADRDSWRNYVESGNYLDDKQDAERWRLVPAFLEHYNYKRLVRDIDDALSREQPQPSNGDREGGAV